MSEQNTAIVTGAGRGIGAAIACRLARDGWRVALAARTLSEATEVALTIRRAGGTALALPCDIRQSDQAHALVDGVRAAFGPTHALVNNAAYAGSKQAFLDTDVDQWRTALETNIIGSVNCVRAVLPDMIAMRAGRIININSLQGSDTAGSPMAYGVSKAGLMRLTDALASEFAESGLRFFDLSPGLVRTRMTSGRPDLDALPESAWSSPDLAADAAAELLSGRYDAMSGRFVRATDDLDVLLRRVSAVEDARILRLVSKAAATVQELA